MQRSPPSFAEEVKLLYEILPYSPKSRGLGVHGGHYPKVAQGGDLHSALKAAVEAGKQGLSEPMLKAISEQAVYPSLSDADLAERCFLHPVVFARWSGLFSTSNKDTGIAIRHSQGYIISIPQGLEMDFRERTQCVPTQKTS